MQEKTDRDCNHRLWRLRPSKNNSFNSCSPTDPHSPHQHHHWLRLIFTGLRVENRNCRGRQTPECMWAILVLSSSAPLLHDGREKKGQSDEKNQDFLKKWRQKALTHRLRIPRRSLMRSGSMGPWRMLKLKTSLATALGSILRQRAAPTFFRCILNPQYCFFLFADSAEIRGRQKKQEETSREECQIKRVRDEQTREGTEIRAA